MVVFFQKVSHGSLSFAYGVLNVTLLFKGMVHDHATIHKYPDPIRRMAALRNELASKEGLRVAALPEFSVWGSVKLHYEAIKKRGALSP